MYKFTFGDLVTFRDKYRTFAPRPAVVIGREGFDGRIQYTIAIKDGYVSPKYPDHQSGIIPGRSVSQDELTAGWDVFSCEEADDGK